MKPITMTIVCIVLLSLRCLPSVAHLFDVSIVMPEQPLVRLTRYEVTEGNLARFQKVLRDYVMQAISRETNIMAEAYYEEKDSSVLWLIERWSSKEAFNQFGEEAVAKALHIASQMALVKPAKTIYIKDLEPISKEEWRRATNKEDRQLTIMLFVDAKQGTEKRFKEVYHLAMPQFRSEAGVVTYQLSEMEEDATQFVTFEKFRSEDAFQYHLGFPPILPVIDYLRTNIKKQPFEDGVHRLIEFAPLTRE